MGISKAIVLILLMMRGHELNGSALTPINRQLSAPARPSNAPSPAVTHTRPLNERTFRPTQQPDYDPTNMIFLICAITFGSTCITYILMSCYCSRNNNQPAHGTHSTLIAPLLAGQDGTEEDPINLAGAAGADDAAADDTGNAGDSPLIAPVVSQATLTGKLPGDRTLPLANPVKQTTNAVSVMALK